MVGTSRGEETILKNAEFLVWANCDPIRDLADDLSTPTAYTAHNSILNDEAAGGQSGTCLQITEDGPLPEASTYIESFVVGEAYRWSFYVKAGTEATWFAYVAVADGEDPVVPGTIYRYVNLVDFGGQEAIGSWVKHQLYFVALDVDYFFFLGMVPETSNGETIYYDELEVIQLTPGEEFDENSSNAPDYWTKSTTLGLIREQVRNVAPAAVTNGAPHSLKAYKGSSNREWLKQTICSGESDCMRFDNKWIQFGASILPKDDGHDIDTGVFITINSNSLDGYTATCNSTWQEIAYNTGTGRQLDSEGALTTFEVGFYFSGDAGSSVWVQNPMLVLGHNVPAFERRKGEVIWLEAPLVLDGDTYLFDNPSAAACAGYSAYVNGISASRISSHVDAVLFSIEAYNDRSYQLWVNIDSGQFAYTLDPVWSTNFPIQVTVLAVQSK